MKTIYSGNPKEIHIYLGKDMILGSINYISVDSML